MNVEKYRRGVGIFLINNKKQLWVGRRSDYKNEYWQMPQGGIDNNETPEKAMKRELMEETGLKRNYEIIGKSKKWLKYKLPKDLINVIWQGKYIGQSQLWFACRFNGSDKEVDIRNFENPEFCEWKWISPLESLELVVPFKRELYVSVIKEFKKFIDYL